MQSADTNPYATPRSSVGAVGSQLQRRQYAPTPRLLKILLVVQLIIIAAAVCAEAYSHPTIIYSGPVFVLGGLFVAVSAYRSRNIPAVAYGASAFAFACLVEFLIKFNHWHASVADEPITTLIVAYTIFAVAVTFWLFRRRPRAGS